MAKILIIDDSRLSRRMTSDVLAETEHVVVEAGDGEQGLAAYEEHRPDCIVLDLLMPRMDGQAFLRRLRNSGANVPVIVVTADIQKASQSFCEEFGVAGFLNKPVEGDKLVTCVLAALTDNLEAVQ